MTNQHPLTEEVMDKIHGDKLGYSNRYDEDDMRVAADWQLEQVIEWLKANLMKHDFHEGYAYLYDDCSNAYIREEELLKDLKEAMRPTTTPHGDTMTKLSPAQKAVAVFNDRYDRCGPFDDDWAEQCLADSLEAVADQVVPPAVILEYYERNESPVLGKAIEVRNKLLAIAAELRGDTNTQ